MFGHTTKILFPNSHDKKEKRGKIGLAQFPSTVTRYVRGLRSTHHPCDRWRTAVSPVRTERSKKLCCYCTDGSARHELPLLCCTVDAMSCFVKPEQIGLELEPQKSKFEIENETENTCLRHLETFQSHIANGKRHRSNKEVRAMTFSLIWPVMYAFGICPKKLMLHFLHLSVVVQNGFVIQFASIQSNGWND